MAIALARVARSQLYGVAPWDPVSIVGPAAAVLAIALLAAWIPAARAVRVTRPAPSATNSGQSRSSSFSLTSALDHAASNSRSAPTPPLRFSFGL